MQAEANVNAMMQELARQGLAPEQIQQQMLLMLAQTQAPALPQGQGQAMEQVA